VSVSRVFLFLGESEAMALGPLGDEGEAVVNPLSRGEEGDTPVEGGGWEEGEGEEGEGEEGEEVGCPGGL